MRFQQSFILCFDDRYDDRRNNKHTPPHTHTHFKRKSTTSVTRQDFFFSSFNIYRRNLKLDVRPAFLSILDVHPILRISFHSFARCSRERVCVSSESHGTKLLCSCFLAIFFFNFRVTASAFRPNITTNTGYRSMVFAHVTFDFDAVTPTTF